MAVAPPATPAPTPGNFTDTRPSVLIRATDGEHVFLQFFFSSRNGLDLEAQHAFAEYRTTPYNIRAGLSPIPFGYENPITSAALITTERSQVSNELIGPFALDRGVFAFYRSTGVFVANPIPVQPGTFNAGIAVVNGEPFVVGNSDTNNTKNVIARVGYFIPNGEIGASVYQGDGTGAVPGTMNRFGADLQWRQGAITALAEYLRGETGSVTGDGGYITVAYRPMAGEAPSKIMVYLRGDISDRNTDVAGDYFSRGTAGVSYYLNPTSKLQAEAETIDDQLNPNLTGRITFQYQIIY